jgi:excisionase family DNA binding protein
MPPQTAEPNERDQGSLATEVPPSIDESARPPSRRPFYTPREAAELLSVRVGHILKWIGSHELAASNLAQLRDSKRPRWRITDNDLQAFVAGRSNRPTALNKPRRRRARQMEVINFF